MKRLWIGWLGIFLAVPLYATQHLKVKDSDAITASISPEHLNRIVLASDRIARIQALDGQFQMQHDESSGELYIKPNLTHLDKELNLYISSEQGFTYALELLPSQESAQTIVLDNSKAGVKDISTRNDNDEIHQLLFAMHHGIGNDEITKQDVNQDTLPTIYNQLAMTPVAHYWGQDYVGEVLIITNDSRKTKIIHESDIADDHTVALVLLSRQLERAEYTYVYRVKHHD